MRSRTKIVYATPLTYEARCIFEDKMNELHSCKVIRETIDMYSLISLNQEHSFWVPKKGNQHWRIEK